MTFTQITSGLITLILYSMIVLCTNNHETTIYGFILIISYYLVNVRNNSLDLSQRTKFKPILKLNRIAFVFVN